MRRVIVGIGCLTALAACVVNVGADRGEGSAVAKLVAASGSPVSGRIVFSDEAGRLMLGVEVVGLGLNADHGMHIHEHGQCDQPAFESAGDHFNPEGGAHAYPKSGPSHAGDLPNLRANAHGEARYGVAVDTIATLQSGAHSIIGRSIVIHRNKDDYRAQPSGDSGPRIACGVIELAK